MTNFKPHPYAFFTTPISDAELLAIANEEAMDTSNPPQEDVPEKTTPTVDPPPQGGKKGKKGRKKDW